jgi:hypothetical protein
VMYGFKWISEKAIKDIVWRKPLSLCRLPTASCRKHRHSEDYF